MSLPVIPSLTGEPRNTASSPLRGRGSAPFSGLPHRALVEVAPNLLGPGLGNFVEEPRVERTGSDRVHVACRIRDLLRRGLRETNDARLPTLRRR